MGVASPRHRFNHLLAEPDDEILMEIERFPELTPHCTALTMLQRDKARERSALNMLFLHLRF